MPVLESATPARERGVSIYRSICNPRLNTKARHRPRPHFAHTQPARVFHSKVRATLRLSDAPKPRHRAGIPVADAPFDRPRGQVD